MGWVIFTSLVIFIGDAVVIRHFSSVTKREKTQDVASLTCLNLSSFFLLGKLKYQLILVLPVFFLTHFTMRQQCCFADKLASCFHLPWQISTAEGNSGNPNNPIFTAPPQFFLSPAPSILARNLFESPFMSIEYLVHALLSKLMVFYRMCVFLWGNVCLHVSMEWVCCSEKGIWSKNKVFLFVWKLNLLPNAYVTLP